jgi:hypothetical protein
MFVVGAPNKGSEYGFVYLIFGQVTIWPADNYLVDSDVWFVGEAPEDRAGWSVDGGGDVNGDGFTACEGDCLPVDPDVHPLAFDECDSVDNDCDGVVDTDDGCECHAGRARAEGWRTDPTTILALLTLLAVRLKFR